MRRNMQNLSFLAIIASLLSCAFFFSQQTRANLDAASAEKDAAEVPQPETLADLPDCSAELTLSEKETCLETAVALSQTILENKVDSLLDQESDSERRIAFVEMQFSWEESRQADCEYVQQMAGETSNSQLAYLDCLFQHNLNRLDELDQWFCQWYPDGGCASSAPGEK